MRYSGSPDQEFKANKMTAEEFTKKANQNTWHFGKTAAQYTGNGNMRAQHISGEKTLVELNELASKNTWPNATHAMTYPEAAESKEDFLKG